MPLHHVPSRSVACPPVDRRHRSVRDHRAGRCIRRERRQPRPGRFQRLRSPRQLARAGHRACGSGAGQYRGRGAHRSRRPRPCRADLTWQRSHAAHPSDAIGGPAGRRRGAPARRLFAGRPRCGRLWPAVDQVDDPERSRPDWERMAARAHPSDSATRQGASCWRSARCAAERGGHPGDVVPARRNVAASAVLLAEAVSPRRSPSVAPGGPRRGAGSRELRHPGRRGQHHDDRPPLHT